jgi:uncharacterized protein YbbK (DUF523 family)
MFPVRVGISSCLLGEAVRYDGGHKRSPVLLERLGGRVEWVSVCPEYEVGMGVPREPVKLVAPAGGTGASPPCLVGAVTGTDWTERMRRFARERARRLETMGLSGYVLKSRSPSCGLQVPLFASREDAASFGDRSGRGLFAAALLERLPSLPVEEECALADGIACERFLQRVLDYHRRLCERMAPSCSS